jgi:hypothetical protein
VWLGRPALGHPELEQQLARHWPEAVPRAPAEKARSRQRARREMLGLLAAGGSIAATAGGGRLADQYKVARAFRAGADDELEAHREAAVRGGCRLTRPTAAAASGPPSSRASTAAAPSRCSTGGHRAGSGATCARCPNNRDGRSRSSRSTPMTPTASQSGRSGQGRASWPTTSTCTRRRHRARLRQARAPARARAAQAEALPMQRTGRQLARNLYRSRHRLLKAREGLARASAAGSACCSSASR